MYVDYKYKIPYSSISTLNTTSTLNMKTFSSAMQGGLNRAGVLPSRDNRDSLSYRVDTTPT